MMKVASSKTAEIKKLQALRLKLHRLDPPQPIRDLRTALAFIKERGIVLSTGRSSMPMLAEAIVGRPIRGSWMADRDVYQIHTLLLAAHRHHDVYAAPLILGKETLIHDALGPAVARVASDRERQLAARSRLLPQARRLLDEVERTGKVRMDRWTASTSQGREARLQLVRELLVVSRELHTESGRHTALVAPWPTSDIARRFTAQARHLQYTDAIDLLILAAIRSALLAPEREVRRWFVFDEDRLDALVVARALQRLGSGKHSWLTYSRTN